MITSWTRHISCGAVALVLAGCATLETSRGYVPDEPLLEEVMVGLDTKTTVRRIVGPPGASGVVREDSWYYVRSDYETFAFRAPVEVDRQVLAISFDEQDRVANIERFGLEDGRVVVLSRRVTTSNTQGVGLIRQLFTNLGNFGPGQLLDNQ